MDLLLFSIMIVVTLLSYHILCYDTYMNMLLVIHIILGIATMVTALSALFTRRARTNHIRTASYGGLGFTYASGIALIVQSPASLTHFCIAGAFYTIVVLASTHFAFKNHTQSATV